MHGYFYITVSCKHLLINAKLISLAALCLHWNNHQKHQQTLHILDTSCLNCCALKHRPLQSKSFFPCGIRTPTSIKLLLKCNTVQVLIYACMEISISLTLTPTQSEKQKGLVFSP